MGKTQSFNAEEGEHYSNIVLYMHSASFIIMCCDHKMHNYFTNYHTPICFDTIVSSSGTL